MHDLHRVRIEPSDGVLHVTLCRGRGNALDRRTLLELQAAFAGAAGQGAPPVVLAATGKSFCTGLDLHEAVGLDRAGMASLMLEFHRAVSACFGYPGPTVAAIGGHAVAGGALLALACDVRLIADAGLSFGIPGIHLGVAYPDVALEVLRAQLAPPHIERLLFDGSRMAPEEAAHLEVVEEPVPADSLHGLAQQRALELARVPPAAYAAAKRSARGAALRSLEEGAARGEAAIGAQAWLDVWFSPATRRLVEARRASLAGAGDTSAGMGSS